MKIQCPNRGKQIVDNGLGRKPLNIPIKNSCGALQAYHNVEDAATKARLQPRVYLQCFESKVVESTGYHFIPHFANSTCIVT